MPDNEKCGGCKLLQILPPIAKSNGSNANNQLLKRAHHKSLDAKGLDAKEIKA